MRCDEDIDAEDEDLGIAEFPFDSSRIDIVSNQVSVYNIVERLRNDEINLTPDFQRLPNLWKPDVQSRLIESLILGIPLQAFYFDAQRVVANQGQVQVPYSREVWQVVDGLQRLSAIKNFILKGMPLSGLEYLVALNGRTFDGLPSSLRRNILESTLLVYLIRAGTPEDIKFNIFKRVNTGGLPLTQQEIRHALFRGVGTELLARIADTDVFHRLVGLAANKRMLDCEFVNRYLAFYVLDAEESYRSMDLFLNDALRFLNSLQASRIEQIFTVSVDALETVERLWGRQAFRRYIDGEWNVNRQVNKALFETIMAEFAKLLPEQRAELKGSTRFVREYKRLWREPALDVGEDNLSFDQCISTSTGNRRRVLRRHDIFRRFLQNEVKSI